MQHRQARLAALFAALIVAIPGGLPLTGSPTADAQTLTAGSWVAHSVASRLDQQLRGDRLEHPGQTGRTSRRQQVRKRRRNGRGFVQLTSGPGLQVRNPDRAWGLPLTVTRLRQVLASYQQQFPQAPAVQVHDLSRRWGGRLEPHASHRAGRDVDLRLVLRNPTRRHASVTPRTLDLERTWFLIERLVDTCDVEFIFLDRRLQRVLYRHARRQGIARERLAHILQYPFRRLSGIVRHSKGHTNHMHVRFRHPRQQRMQHSAESYCRMINCRPGSRLTISARPSSPALPAGRSQARRSLRDARIFENSSPALPAGRSQADGSSCISKRDHQSIPRVGTGSGLPLSRSFA